MKQYSHLIHASLVLAAGALTVVSSEMAYALPDLTVILTLLGGAIALQLVMWRMRKGGILTDAMTLAATVLEALSLSRILSGRANLMGYVWFSDLESGNQVAVTALWLAVAAMAVCAVAILMNVILGFGEKNQ